MKHILALVDGSGYAQSVCDHAGWMAARTGANVHFCHVMKSRAAATGQTDLSGSIGLGARSALLEELAEIDRKKANVLKERGRAILEDAAQRATAMGATQVDSTLRYGRFIESVAELEADADLVVIGKRGETSHIDMEHLGSNLERVVRSTSRPVLVASRQFKEIKKVLIAFDGGQSILKAVAHMATSSLLQGREVQLVQAGDKSSAGKGGPIDAACDTLQSNGIKAVSHQVNGQPEQVIGNMVEKDGIDLLIMGAYGHSKIRHLIIGSTTTQMVQNCKVPILLFR
jgi:nucleotide-binding universal stress UspA family protein